MARTAGSDGIRTEEAIRKAAIELIAAQGFDSVTLRGLAAHVGLQAGSLYRYYRSKDDLLATIITRHMDDLLSAWEAGKPHCGTAAERLHHFIEFHVRYHAEKQREVFIGNMEMRSLLPADRDRVVAMRKRYEDILIQILRDGVAEGQFSLPDIQIASFAILAMLTGLTAWYQEGGRLSREQLIDCYTQLVTSGVGAVFPSPPSQKLGHARGDAPAF